MRGGGGVQPKKTLKKPNPKQMGIAGNVGFFWVFLEKGVESTFSNIPNNLRPTYSFHVLGSCYLVLN